MIFPKQLGAEEFFKAKAGEPMLIDEKRKGTLYLCATPIGNLEDITLRVLRILQEADYIAAEDTRRTGKLLSHYGINTPLFSYHEHNRKARGEEVLKRLTAGQDIALVTDAGMPGIADPGTELVKKVIDAGLSVVSLPGATALITALVVSGLPTESFVFAGFPPRRPQEREGFFRRLLLEERTVIFYEAPHRLLSTLAELAKQAPDRPLVIARELTKIHEEIRRGTVGQHLRAYQRAKARGEFCLVLEGAGGGAEGRSGAEKEALMGAVVLVEKLIALGVSKKEAIPLVAREKNISKRLVYNSLIAKERGK